jgi:hypothetical protein
LLDAAKEHAGNTSQARKTANLKELLRMQQKSR